MLQLSIMVNLCEGVEEVGANHLPGEMSIKKSSPPQMHRPYVIMHIR